MFWGQVEPGRQMVNLVECSVEWLHSPSCRSRCLDAPMTERSADRVAWLHAGLVVQRGSRMRGARVAGDGATAGRVCSIQVEEGPLRVAFCGIPNALGMLIPWYRTPSLTLIGALSQAGLSLDRRRLGGREGHYCDRLRQGEASACVGEAGRQQPAASGREAELVVVSGM